MPTPEFVFEIPVRRASLAGNLAVPANPRGVVIFAHGGGSNRLSPRNRAVAKILHAGHFATLLVDLLTSEENGTDRVAREYRFNIPFLSDRLATVMAWVEQEERVCDLPVGLFGTSTGAASALVAAAQRPQRVHAIVSHGGRPDLAWDALEAVQAPTLLIVGSHDLSAVTLNEAALRRLSCVKQLEIVPGATHLFEESGALAKVAALARAWLERFLQPVVLTRP